MLNQLLRQVHEILKTLEIELIEPIVAHDDNVPLLNAICLLHQSLTSVSTEEKIKNVKSNILQILDNREYQKKIFVIVKVLSDAQILPVLNLEILLDHCNSLKHLKKLLTELAPLVRLSEKFYNDIIEYMTSWDEDDFLDFVNLFLDIPRYGISLTEENIEIILDITEDYEDTCHYGIVFKKLSKHGLLIELFKLFKDSSITPCALNDVLNLMRGLNILNFKNISAILKSSTVGYCLERLAMNNILNLYNFKLIFENDYIAKEMSKHIRVLEEKQSLTLELVSPIFARVQTVYNYAQSLESYDYLDCILTELQSQILMLSLPENNEAMGFIVILKDQLVRMQRLPNLQKLSLIQIVCFTYKIICDYKFRNPSFDQVLVELIDIFDKIMSVHDQAETLFTDKMPYYLLEDFLINYSDPRLMMFLPVWASIKLRILVENEAYKLFVILTNPICIRTYGALEHVITREKSEKAQVFWPVIGYRVKEELLKSYNPQYQIATVDCPDLQRLLSTHSFSRLSFMNESCDYFQQRLSDSLGYRKYILMLFSFFPRTFVNQDATDLCKSIADKMLHTMLVDDDNSAPLLSIESVSQGMQVDEGSTSEHIISEGKSVKLVVSHTRRRQRTNDNTPQPEAKRPCTITYR